MTTTVEINLIFHIFNFLYHNDYHFTEQMLLYVRNITLFTYILLFDKVYKIETQSGSFQLISETK